MVSDQISREHKAWLDKYPLEYWQANVGPGWAELVEQAFNLTVMAGTIPMDVKEKFGGLRFYTGSVHKDSATDLWDAIDAIERRSYEICEKCGRRGKPRPLNWIKTLCFRHYLPLWYWGRVRVLRFRIQQFKRRWK